MDSERREPPVGTPGEPTRGDATSPAAASPAADAAAAEKKKKKKKDKVRSAWISFAGRIVAQIVGAAATVALGVMVLHRYSATDPRPAARSRWPCCPSTTSPAMPRRSTSSTA